MRCHLAPVFPITQIQQTYCLRKMVPRVSVLYAFFSIKIPLNVHCTHTNTFIFECIQCAGTYTSFIGYRNIQIYTHTHLHNKGLCTYTNTCKAMFSFGCTHVERVDHFNCHARLNEILFSRCTPLSLSQYLHDCIRQ